MTDTLRPIAFQGNPGAYSHQACREAFPGLPALPCATFEEAIAAVNEERAALAMLPIENSTYGRIADIHHLLPESGLHIIGEHFVRVHANLLVIPGTKLEQVKTVLSQPPLLGQVRGFVRRHGIATRAGA
ncbi:prephenate dehydratase domain-containing protein, partial [Amaricoccus sp.]|uniref:prephenate dehydratase domain-containing protein n=1 Tax=Amaricoccus sp. TaxID=1872485 RepID=UPI001B5B1937